MSDAKAISEWRAAGERIWWPKWRKWRESGGARDCQGRARRRGNGGGDGARRLKRSSPEVSPTGVEGR
eukprot:13481679-Alexandrium_andersonii.AAC.1